MPNEPFQALDKSSYKPLYVQLAEILVQYANDRRLKKGDILPSENELLSRFDVSRNTVRLAVERLVKMGFATKIRGQGTFVAQADKDCRIDYHCGFEGSIRRLGKKAANSLVEIRPVNSMPGWAQKTGTIEGGSPVLIKRLKMVDDQLTALEERLLPAHVPGRYSPADLENENISPDLLEQFPDTQTTRFSYVFACHSLNALESRLLKQPKGTCFLSRIGEYFNPLGERFMISRLLVCPDRITLWYEFELENDSWIMKS